MVRKRSATDGFTLVEVLMAIAVLAIVLSAVSLTVVSSIRQNVSSGSRSQAAQVLNYLGRRISGGEMSMLGGTEWDYGQLTAAFADLSRETDLADPDLYRAQIEQVGEMGIETTSVPQFRVQVCWRMGGEETCVVGDTAGSAAGGESGELLPGLN